MLTTSKPINKALVSIKKAFIDEVTTDGGLTLYLDPSYAKEHNVASLGTITALSTDHKPEYNELVSRLKIGDEVAFSYRVVADFAFSSDGAQFIDTMPHNPGTFKKYTNGKGEWVVIRALPKKVAGMTWVGLYHGKGNVFIDGCQGTEADVSRWFSQFNLGKTDKYVFNNLIDIDGEELWKVEYSEIFAKKDKGGNIVAIGDRIICEPLDVPLHEQMKALHGIELPEGSILARWQDRARVISGCKKLGLSKGDIIGFDPKYMEKYSLWGKELYLIKHRRVDFLWATAN